MGQSTPIGSKTILIVEDEALLRFDLVDFFEHAGWRVFEAEHADAAITILERHTEVRVVLTDVQMPGSMDGVKLAHFIRDRFPPTVLFVVSGNVRIPQYELPTLTSFLPNPFDHHRLLRTLEALIDYSR